MFFGDLAFGLLIICLSFERRSNILSDDDMERSKSSIRVDKVVNGHKNLCVKKTKTL